VVVRPGLPLVLLAVLGTVLGLAAPVLVHELFGPGTAAAGDLWARARLWLGDVRLWVALALTAAVAAAVYVNTLIQLRQRSAELRREFEESYPPVQGRGEQ
jgi:hypothetical protein